MSEEIRTMGQKRRLPRWMRINRARPGLVALLWVINGALAIIDWAFFPDGQDYRDASSFFVFGGTSLFVALIVAWVLRARSTTLGLMAMFATLDLLFELLWLALEFMGALTSVQTPNIWLVFGLHFLVVIAILESGYRRIRPLWRRLVAFALAAIIPIIGPTTLLGMNPTFDSLSEQAQNWLNPDRVREEAERDADREKSDIEPDRLWEAQPALVDAAVQSLRPRIPQGPNIYALAVAPMGTMHLFSREGQRALQVFSARYSAAYRGGVLLANSTDDLLKRPLATKGNLTAITAGLAGKADPSRDLLFVYLSSHGSRDAELSSDMPTYQDIVPISAPMLAEALDKAHIRRRVIVVSACFSATWIPFLANADSIVITAAAKDRTSFGCDDSRSLTYFGEAFLNGPLAKGASLSEAFETARRTIRQWEARDHLTPSNPQAYVGRNMQALWKDKGRR